MLIRYMPPSWLQNLVSTLFFRDVPLIGPAERSTFTGSRLRPMTSSERDYYRPGTSERRALKKQRDANMRACAAEAAQ